MKTTTMRCPSSTTGFPSFAPTNSAPWSSSPMASLSLPRTPRPRPPPMPWTTAKKSNSHFSTPTKPPTVPTTAILRTSPSPSTAPTISPPSAPTPATKASMMSCLSPVSLAAPMHRPAVNLPVELSRSQMPMGWTTSRVSPSTTTPLPLTAWWAMSSPAATAR